MSSIIEITTTGQNTVEVTSTENSMSVEVINQQAVYEVEVQGLFPTQGNGDVYLAGVDQHFTEENFFDGGLGASELIVYPGFTTVTGFAIYQQGSFVSATPEIWLINLPAFATNDDARANGLDTDRVYRAGNSLKMVMPDGYVEPEGGIHDFVFNETPSGAINGSNATFTTAYNFIPESVQVFAGVARLSLLDDYNTSGNTTINLFASPLPGENIRVSYIKQ